MDRRFFIESQPFMKLHWEILDRARMNLVPRFKPWTDQGFFLGGGTALALQLGHRTSLVFDFYSTTVFKPLELVEQLGLPRRQVRLTTQKPDTLHGVVAGVQVSAFRYRYKDLARGPRTPELRLASLEDLAAMKILAVTQRGTKRDFIDLYWLCRSFSIDEILSFAEKKFPMFDRYNGLRGLLYFDEAEAEPARMGVRMLKPIAWGDVKAFFVRSVQKFI